MGYLSIGEVAQQVGVQTSAIRYYESIGLLAEPARVSGQRRYADEVINRLRVIRVAQGLGFTLDEIKTLLDGFSPDTPPSERWQAMARTKLPEIDAIIERATTMRRLLNVGLDCQCVALEDCLSRYDEYAVNRYLNSS